MKKILKTLKDYRPLIVGWIWVILLIPGLLWWSESVPFLVIMSLYANVESSFATYAGKKDQRKLDTVQQQLDDLKEAIRGR